MNVLSMLSTLALELPNIAIGLLVVLFLFISVVMILIVLIQKPQGGGLSGAFGSSSDGAGQTAFGAKTGDVLTTATIVIFLVFLTTAVVLNFAVRPNEISNATTVASSDDTVPSETAPGDQQIPPVTPPAQTTQTPAPPAGANPPPVSINLTNPDGSAGPAMTPVTDPRILEMLNQGVNPDAAPEDDAVTPPAEPETPPAETPAEEPPADGGN